MLYISTHACERYLQRVLHMDSWTDMDIEQTRKTLQRVIFSQKHTLISKTEKKLFKLVDGLIIVCLKARKLLVTLFPATEETILRLKQRNKPTNKSYILNENNYLGVNNTYEIFNPAFSWAKVNTKGSSLEWLFQG